MLLKTLINLLIFHSETFQRCLQKICSRHLREEHFHSLFIPINFDSQKPTVKSRLPTWLLSDPIAIIDSIARVIHSI
jgi:hypothetical protein